jgi:hypothetical protein
MRGNARSRARLSGVALAVLLMIFVSSGCGSGESDSVQVQSGVYSGAVVKAGAWTELAPPDQFAGREQVLALPVDAKRGVVFGGLHIDSQSLEVAADGALVDTQTGEWTSIPPAPGLTLGHLSGAIFDQTLIVAGTECSSTKIYPDIEVPDGPASPPCPEGPVALRRYDLSSGKWDLVTSVPEDMLANATSVSTVAQKGSTIVLVAYHVTNGQESGTVLTYNTESQDWAMAPAPSEPIDRTCWVDDALVSFERTHIGDKAGDTPDSHDEHGRLELWRPGDPSWTATEPTSEINSSYLLRLLCTADSAIIDSGPVAGERGRLASYSPSTHEWVELPSKPTGVPGFGTVSADSLVAIWNAPPPEGADTHLHILDVAAAKNGWIDAGPVPVDPTALQFEETPNPTSRVFGVSGDEYLAGDLQSMMVQQ